MSLTPGGASPKIQKRVKNLALRKFIDSQPVCALCGKPGTPQNIITHHHIKTWGSGGEDEGNMVPLHWYGCHTTAHSMSVERLSGKIGRDLRAYAVQLTAEFNESRK